MSEQELKLHIPPQSRLKIKKALEKAESITLRAMYFDTSDRQLAKAKVAIRLRQEGTDWVQTLKMAGANSLSRVELNHHRPGPVLDLSLYAGTVAEAVLANLTQPLELRYETDVTRLFKKQRTKKGTVEIAFDTGVVRAGRLELPINEVEFELKSGSIEAMFDLGLRWLNDYQLILDTRSKSHRGDALANMMHKINTTDNEHQLIVEQQETQRFWAERKAVNYTLPKHLNATQALCRLTEECLEQMALNAAYLAEVDTRDVMTVAKPEHVHQLRIGMRRLASNWKLLDGYAHLPDESLRQELKVFLGNFGATRDTDVMLETIMPPLEKAGMPHLELDHYQGRTASELARDVDFQTFLVKLLAWVATAPNTDPIPEKASNEKEDEIVSETTSTAALAEVSPSAESVMLENQQASSTTTDIVSDKEQNNTVSTTNNDDISVLPVPTQTTLDRPFLDIIPLVPSQLNQYSLRKILEKRLNKWNNSIVHHWKKNDRSDIESYHDLRKKIKRMRYGLNVYEGLEGHASLNNYVKKLANAQEVFGQLNDCSTALSYFSSITHKYPEAWFAVGWLSAQISRLKKDSDKVLKELPRKIQFS
ncbi:adenylate cyclase [Pelistega indica]|uniref:Adenylate cyclase n=1 Tax=Pelistega indica TaxID=1414851 RepID=V8G754_9BURK|nr:CYTH and CHAD domain-containing protein [Pelistega indica]ETD72374.1 adenylate cyclase [Pelistega indica]